jgi:hypothetical protein
MYPILFAISASYETMYDKFVCTNENFKTAFIVDNKKMTRDLETNLYLTKNFFGLDFFSLHANKLYCLTYSDFYAEDGAMIPAATVVESTGVPLTVLMIQTLRGVCSVAKTKYSKKELELRGSVDVRTFVMRSKRGSKRFRLLMAAKSITDTPHNINKFAQNMDIIINGTQAAFLNALWTNNFFNNNTKTFFFKFHNNTLGYNHAVAHFVAGHSPCCTFCDAAGDADINAETGLHLFLECAHVSGIVDNIFNRITGLRNFQYSRREYFSTFERRNFSYAKNLMLTFISKLTIKMLWDFKVRFSQPTVDVCWENLHETVSTLKSNNKKFSKLWEASGLSL